MKQQFCLDRPGDRSTASPNESERDLRTLLDRSTNEIASPTLPTVVLGELVAVAVEVGGPMPLVRFRDRREAVFARSCVDLQPEQVGCSVAIVFENGDPSSPIIMGVLRSGSARLDAPGHVTVAADGTRLAISASERLVLRCGRASIILTEAGKIIIEGAYVVTRATGTNRILGGSVQIN